MSTPDPMNRYAVREERREQLEELYLDGLIEEFTMNPGATDETRTPLTWTIDMFHVETPVTITSADVPLFVLAVRAGAAAAPQSARISRERRK